MACRYRPVSPCRPDDCPSLRVALFSDTSTARHYGCTAVVDSLERLFQGAGIAIDRRHPVQANALDDPGTKAGIAPHHAVVVNGEGTIHGRFHAVCLAMVLRVPFHALPSITWKIQAMEADACLDAARLLAPEAVPPPPLPRPLPWSPVERTALDRYLALARGEALAMAQRIRSG